MHLPHPRPNYSLDVAIPNKNCLDGGNYGFGVQGEGVLMLTLKGMGKLSHRGRESFRVLTHPDKGTNNCSYCNCYCRAIVINKGAQNSC